MVETTSRALSTAAAAFLIEATACKSTDALDRHFSQLTQALGFRSAIFVNLSSAGAPIKPRVLFGENHAPWLERYLEANYARLDPTIPRAFRSRDPFTWKDAEPPNASRRVKQFFGEAREIWAEDGLIVPIHGPFGEFSVVNLLSDCRIDLADEEIGVLRGVCNVYASVALTIAEGALPSPPAAEPSLSRRERQCIYWMAMGKHDAQTAEILGISAHTVREYLDSAKAKLAVETRPEMSLKALAFGLLVPDGGMMI